MSNALHPPLTQAVRAAFDARDRMQTLEWNGANVHLYITDANVIYLQLWRSDVFPTAAAWQTFLSELPPEVQSDKPVLHTVAQIKHRKSIIAHWRIPPKEPHVS